MKKILAALSVALAVSACDNENTSTFVFSIKVDSKVAITDKSWVIVRNSGNGELIDYKSVIPGETLTFTSNNVAPSTNIDVTFLRGADYVVYGPAHIYDAVVYTNVDAGSKWTLDSYPEQQYFNETDKTYKLTINDIPPIKNYLYHAEISDNNTYNSRLLYDGKKFFETLLFITASPKQLLSVDVGDGNPKYTFLENLQANTNLDMSYSDLKPFDRIMTVNFPKEVNPTVNVTGYENYPVQDIHFGESMDGYRLYYRLINPTFTKPITTVTIPFLNDLSIYKIQISTPEFDYFSMGPPPSSINYVEASEFEITDESVESFAFKTSKDFVFRTATFEYNSSDSGDHYQYKVTYFSGSEPTKYHQPIPDELIQQFSIPVDKIQFLKADFTIKGLNYSDMLKQPKDAQGGFHLPTPPYETSKVIIGKM